LAHTLGDIGLDFVSIQVAGPKDSVLNLAKRNPARLFETVGDPTSEVNILLSVSFDSEGVVIPELLPLARKLARVQDDFLEAVHLIT